MRYSLFALLVCAQVFAGDCPVNCPCHNSEANAQTAIVVTPAEKPRYSYTPAYSEHMKNGRPMLVLVGAEWCPSCMVMKNIVMPKVFEKGSMKGVLYAVIDTDASPDLAKKLIGNASIPQLVFYCKEHGQPVRKQLSGAQSVESVELLVRQSSQTP